MMAGTDPTDVLQIKKYPNRRYYDTTRSCHVTLPDICELVRTGRDVCVVDSRSGADITNLVLFHILLDQDQPKLDLIPTSIIHLMIRSKLPVIRSSLDRFLGPFMELLSTSQKQFESVWRQAMDGKLAPGVEWMGGMAQAVSPPVPSHPTEGNQDDAGAGASDAPRSDGEETLDELRRQVSELTRRMEKFDPGPANHG
ncbi:MAG: hypothetical protein IID43_03725 [Planctomycetes bacterium]|nr:hypothetical protein [Planctomycetota bacterium]